MMNNILIFAIICVTLILIFHQHPKPNKIPPPTELIKIAAPLLGVYETSNRDVAIT